MRLYNTITRRKEEFTPLKKGQVGIYVCGPTVYDYPHIGHARTYIAFDVLVRYLRYKGYKVKYVVNITNVDDKIIQRAREAGKDAIELADEYEKVFHEDMAALGIQSPDVYPRVTDHIATIIDLIKRLLKNGYAYEVDGDVYYSVEKTENYGRLSRQALEDMIAGARVDVDARKRHPMDFALWKRAKKGEVSWPSPWGHGRPGWHIECSAMSTKYLGDTFDIHGGAMDLIFPHHENEILQVEGATNREFVKYWVHTGFLNVEGEKMSKSLGNFITIRELLGKYPPEVFRFFVLGAHYRSPIDFSYEGLDKAARSLERLINAVEHLRGNTGKEMGGSNRLGGLIEKVKKEFFAALEDDLNTPEALAVIFNFIRAVYKIDLSRENRKGIHDSIAFLEEVGRIFGVPLVKKLPSSLREKLKILAESLGIKGVKEKGAEELIEEIINLRASLRKQGDYKAADDIRGKLLEIGIALEDRGEGTTWRAKFNAPIPKQ
jgi:cysteinyl-tRNA synthetase